MYKIANNSFSFPESIIDLVQNKVYPSCLIIIIMLIQIPKCMEWPSHNYHLLQQFTFNMQHKLHNFK